MVVFSRRSIITQGIIWAGASAAGEPIISGPYIKTPAGISPASGEVGTVFTLSEGTYGGTAPLTLTGRLTLDGVDVTGALDRLRYTSTAPGALLWTVTASNAGGTAVSTAGAEVEESEAPRDEEASTTLMTSWEKDGVTVSFFDAATGGNPIALPVCQDCLGDYVIISDEEFYFETTPASVQDGGAGNFWMHGLVHNPFMPEDGRQGWDESLSAPANASAMKIDYDHSLNVDPGATGRRIHVPKGSKGSWLKWVRKSNISPVPGSYGGEVETARAQVPITVLDEVPARGFFLPSPSDLDTKVVAKESDASYSVLNRLQPVSGMPMDVANTRFTNLNDYGYGSTETGYRRLGMEASAGNGSNYSSDCAPHRAYELMRLHTDIPDADKRDSFMKMIRYGLWRWEEYKRSVATGTGHGKGRHGAGQWNGYLPYVVLAGAALGRQDILDDALEINTNFVGQPRWTQPGDVGRSVLWRDYLRAMDIDRRNRTAMPQDVGYANTASDSRGWAWTQRYTTTTALAIVSEVLAIALIRNLPNGASGGDWLLGYGPADNTNPRAASIAWSDVIWAYNKAGLTYVRPMPSWLMDLYAEQRTLVSGMPWPDRTPLHNPIVPKNYLTALDGGISYNFSNTDLSFPGYPDTQRDLRVSMGEVQFVEYLDVGDSGTLSDMPRVTLAVQERRQNASGTGVWSDNYQVSGAGLNGLNDVRMMITPSGTPSSAAPVFTEGPRLFYRPYNWSGPWYEEVTSEADLSNVGTLHAGEGFLDGDVFPAPSVEWKWQRRINGGASEDIAGADAQSYDRTGDDLSSATDSVELRAGVRYTNSAGNSDWAYTGWSEMPERPVFAENVVIDSQMDARLPLFWPDIYNNITAHNGNLVLASKTFWNGFDIPPGGLAVDKTSARPTMIIYLGTLPAGTYRIKATVLAGFSVTGVAGAGRDWRKSTAVGPHRFDIQSNISGAYKNVYPIEPAHNPESGVPVATYVDETWVHPGGGCRIYCTVNTSTGGANGGNFILADRLTVTREDAA